VTFFTRFRRKAIAPHAKHRPREVEVARRREEARRRRQEAFGSPPLSELEVDMRYGAVEQERARG
jgi:hypothetical protein